jgi:hypothetical protein
MDQCLAELGEDILHKSTAQQEANRAEGYSRERHRGAHPVTQQISQR